LETSPHGPILSGNDFIFAIYYIYKKRVKIRAVEYSWYKKNWLESRDSDFALTAIYVTPLIPASLSCTAMA
jgi:hypothetical protein